ncbi:sugar transporter SemiSWEET [Geothrix limicola]|uniref:Sugar transporter SemiSWEET n=1 Tax=Geothrix limicola TaxID=2927978 RepID=A0ABQ5QAB5_9BACT|nr:SemiSWEET transporter [Geothrix limicola]GLH71767.1 sugar transporter SemiSWEET [Geothrix limicola]
MSEWIGFMAAFCTTASFLPQVWRVWKTRSVNDISLGMYVLFVLGVALWFIFGLAIHSLPVVLANGITLILAALVLVAKIRFG